MLPRSINVASRHCRPSRRTSACSPFHFLTTVLLLEIRSFRTWVRCGRCANQHSAAVTKIRPGQSAAYSVLSFLFSHLACVAFGCLSQLGMDRWCWLCQSAKQSTSTKQAVCKTGQTWLLGLLQSSNTIEWYNTSSALTNLLQLLHLFSSLNNNNKNNRYLVPGRRAAPINGSPNCV